MIANHEERYAAVVAEMIAAGLVDRSELPTLEALTQTIKDTMEDEALSFPDFESFFAWWDVVTAYDQMDEESSAERHKPASKRLSICWFRRGTLSRPGREPSLQSAHQAPVAQLIEIRLLSRC